MPKILAREIAQVAPTEFELRPVDKRILLVTLVKKTFNDLRGLGPVSLARCPCPRFMHSGQLLEILSAFLL